MTHTVSETLNLAADLIEKRGWGTGDWEVAGPLCIEGAIAAVLGATTAESSMALALSCPAVAAVHDYLGETPFVWNDKLPWTPTSITLSDGSVVHGLGFVGGSREAAVAFGKARVLEVLRAAAVVEAARESARESVTA